MSTTTRTILVAAAALVAVALIVVLSRPVDPPVGRPEAASRHVPEEDGDAHLKGRAALEPPPAEDPIASPAAEPVADPDEEWRLEIEIVAPSGAAPESCSLRFGSADLGASVKGSAGPDGRATLVVRGTGHLVVLPSGDWTPWTSERLSPPPSGTHRLTVELAAGLEIRGLVLGPEGRPVGARIVAEPLAAWTWIDRLPPWTWRAHTDKSGSFCVRGLLSGTYRLRVRLRPNRGNRQPSGLLPAPPEVEAGGDDVVIRLLPASGIALRLADADSGETVRSMADVYFVEDGEDRRRSGFTGGTLLLDEAPGTRMRLRICAEGYEPSEVLDLAFREAGAGEARDVLLMRDPGGLVAVTFRLRDEDGGVVPAITATRWFERGTPENPSTFGIGSAHQTPDGALVLPLPPGRHRLDFRVEAKEDEDRALLLSESVELELERGEPVERDVVFARGGGIRIHHPKSWQGGMLVRRPDGTKAPRFGIRMLDGGGRVFSRIPRGAWVLTFLLADGGKHEVPVEVAPGEYTDVRFDPNADPPR